MDKKLVFRYLFEIIVIVFSVTLSFYIQEVLNDREKEELKNETLLGVIDDLGQTKFFFNQSKIYFNERIKRTEKIIETKKINSEDLLWVVEGWGWRVNAPSFESLIATGAAEYISYKELYKQLIGFYDQSVLLNISETYTEIAYELRKYLNENYAIKSMITAEKFFNQNEWPTGIYYDYDDKLLMAMSQDDVVLNYIYQLKAYNIGMLFWVNIYEERLPELKESIEKEISS